MVSDRKPLQILGAKAVAENSKDGHQQKKALRVADPAALAALRKPLKKTDQIGLIGSGNMRLGQGSEAMRPSQPQEKGRRQGEAGWLSAGPAPPLPTRTYTSENPLTLPD